MKTNILLNKLAKKFPKKYAKMNHDFVGLMVGKKPEEVHKIVLILDMDLVVLPKILEIKPDLVITHHPFLFGPKAKILKSDEKKRFIKEELEKRNIALYSYHTNFDTGKDGMNDALSNALNLKNIYAPQKDIMMRIGELDKEMEVHEFSKYACKCLGVNYSLLINYGKDKIKKVGIIGGGGSRSYIVAQEEGCDIFISGDAPHHVRRGVVDDKFNYLDMPHEIEHIFMEQMKKILLGFDSSLEIITFDHEIIPEPIII